MFRLALSAIALVPCAAARADAPHRIVSANLCADRLVLQLADRANIVSVSHYATDPRMSTVTDAAAGIPANRAQAEEIAALHPDLVVLGSSQTSRTAAAMLRSLGIAVHIVPAAKDVGGAAKAIRELSAALGVPKRGEDMIAKISAGLDTLPKDPDHRRAAVYLAGGWSAGRGTLANDLLDRLGLVNIAAMKGVSGLGALPLETLVAAKPDLLVYETIGDAGPSIAGSLLDNPALAETGARILRMPTRLWACPDPAIVDAAALIAKSRP